MDRYGAGGGPGGMVGAGGMGAGGGMVGAGGMGAGGGNKGGSMGQNMNMGWSSSNEQSGMGGGAQDSRQGEQV